jgi:3-hydroxyisobutyrate dehydrogenase-like beta-hydroxyacid dehydrogenase
MTYGFIGLGDMGGPIAANIAKGGTSLFAFDPAGTEARAPGGAQCCQSVPDAAQQANVLFVCVPDGNASKDVLQQIVAADNRRTHTVIDLSTTGVEHAKEVGALAADHDIQYIDSPVSGGRAGAKAGTITVIWGGPLAVLQANRAVIDSMSGNVFHVGNHAGQGQAMKLLNNFLSATAMAATSEAILYGESQGLDMKTMLDVVNVSTGQNTATSDKFKNRVLTESFDAGFRTRLMRKDVRLFNQSVASAGTPNRVTSLVDGIWDELEEARPDSDFTEIYLHLRERLKQ